MENENLNANRPIGMTTTIIISLDFYVVFKYGFSILNILSRHTFLYDSLHCVLFPRNLKIHIKSLEFKIALAQLCLVSTTYFHCLAQRANYGTRAI